MVRMRILASEEMKDIIFYGCSAHNSNLLAKDICKLDRYSLLLKKITAVMKFFISHKVPRGWYHIAGGKQLILAKQVRWNTFADELRSYLDNFNILLEICANNEGHPALKSSNDEDSVDIGIIRYKFFSFIVSYIFMILF